MTAGPPGRDRHQRGLARHLSGTTDGVLPPRAPGREQTAPACGPIQEPWHALAALLSICVYRSSTNVDAAAEALIRIADAYAKTDDAAREYLQRLIANHEIWAEGL